MGILEGFGLLNSTSDRTGGKIIPGGYTIKFQTLEVGIDYEVVDIDVF